MRQFIHALSPSILAYTILVMAGCDDKPTTPSAHGQAATSSPVAASAGTPLPADSPLASAPASAPALVEPMHDTRMGNCPSAAPGATVAMRDVEGGIEISITGQDEAVVKEIKSRMSKLVEADRTAVNVAAAAGRHDHMGSGGGRSGHCIIVLRKTKLETADLSNGIKATVKASDKADVDWLRRETRDREREAKMPGIESAGTRHMAHCPSAVPGARTAVKDAKEGVVVTVTGDGDAVKDIRERAKHAAEVARLPEPPKVEHNSEGRGGGGLGKCPVIVEGDTTVDVKDVANGTEITVKAKKDVLALQKEAKLRAAGFAGK